MNPELFNVRLVIVFLGILTLTSLIFAGLLAMDAKPIPDFLVASGSGGIAALGALLSKTSTTPPGPQEVRVVESASDPVVVEGAE